MPHPGRIIYAHPPRQDGLRYFYLLYHHRSRSCELRAASMDRQELVIDEHPLDLLDMLEKHDIEGAWWSEEVSLRAARALMAYLVRRQPGD